METQPKPQMPKGKRVEIEAVVRIPESEAYANGKRGADLKARREMLDVELAKVSAEYRREMRDLKKESDRLLSEFHTGRSCRTVKAIEIRNFGTKKVEHWFAGEKVAERDMNEEDLQGRIDDMIEAVEGEEADYGEKD